MVKLLPILDKLLKAEMSVAEQPNSNSRLPLISYLCAVGIIHPKIINLRLSSNSNPSRQTGSLCREAVEAKKKSKER